MSQTEHDVALRGWRPDLDESLSLPPVKRARMVATTRLYDQLCAQVSSALREREQRDQFQRAASRDLAERFPLTFPDPGRSSPEPARAELAAATRAGGDSALAKTTPSLPPMKENSALALSSLVLDDSLPEISVIKAKNGKHSRPVSLSTLRKVGSEESMVELEDMPELPNFDGGQLLMAA